LGKKNKRGGEREEKLYIKAVGNYIKIV